MKKKFTLCATVSIGVIFILLVGVVCSFPFKDPDRWQYVSAHGIALTLQYLDKNVTFTLAQELTDGAQYVPTALAHDAQARGAEAALKSCYPSAFAAVEAWLLSNVEISPVNAKLIPDVSAPFRVQAGKTGRETDRPKFYSAALREILHGGGTVFVPTQTTEPNVTKVSLYAEMEYRGGYETNIASSSPERKHNVRLALSRFDGLTVVPRQRVSFNDVVGARTEEAGYKIAKVIYSGEYIDGIGGGVCQASSTLYNAVMLSGLGVDTVFQHSLPPSYVSPGRDAMVNSAGADLVLYNPTARAVHFRVYADDERVRVEIFGERSQNRYSLESRVTGVVAATQEIKEDDGTYSDRLQKADSYVVRVGKDGLTSETYLHVIYPDGSEFVKRVRSNFYAPVNALTVVKKQADKISFLGTSA